MNTYNNTNNNEIENAIDFLKEQIESDLHELNGDTESNYAHILLSGHEHIKVAIRELEKILDPTHGYAE